ncbi:hypothetical protein BJY59DRAFT_699216 [Rhodotorula toruloides]
MHRPLTLAAMLSIRSLGRLLGSLVCVKVDVSEPPPYDQVHPASPASLDAPPRANASDRRSATTVDLAGTRATSEAPVRPQESRPDHPLDEASPDEPPSPRLPPELLLSILEHVLADESTGRDTLTRVCRTSKDMRHLAEPLLYRNLSFVVLVCYRRIICNHNFQCLSPPNLSLTQEQAARVRTLKLKVARISCEGRQGRGGDEFLPTCQTFTPLQASRVGTTTSGTGTSPATSSNGSVRVSRTSLPSTSPPSVGGWVL